MLTRIMIAVLIIAGSLEAKQLSASYRITHPLFGQIGIADAELIVKGSVYSNTITLTYRGMARTLSKYGRETYVSQGHMHKGLLVTDRHTITKLGPKKNKIIIYRIDHRHKLVTREEKTHHKLSGKKSKEKESIPYYAKEDITALFFNAQKYIADKKRAANYRFDAVGAERQKGTIDIRIPAPEKCKKYYDDFGLKEESWCIEIAIYNKIFAKNQGRLVMLVGKDGTAQKGFLGPITLFGQLTAERIK